MTSTNLYIMYYYVIIQYSICVYMLFKHTNMSESLCLYVAEQGDPRATSTTFTKCYVDFVSFCMLKWTGPFCFQNLTISMKMNWTIFLHTQYDMLTKSISTNWVARFYETSIGICSCIFPAAIIRLRSDISYVQVIQVSSCFSLKGKLCASPRSKKNLGVRSICLLALGFRFSG